MNTKIIFLSFIVAFTFSGFLFGQKNYRTLVYEGNEKFDGKDYSFLSIDNGLNDNNVAAIFEDSKG